MSTHDDILYLMKDPRFDAPGSQKSRVEMVEELITRDGWESVKSSLLTILSEMALVTHWYDAASVLWGGLLDNRALEADYTIAVLYRHLKDHPSHGTTSLSSFDNLAWSIASKLKKVDYLSDYDPLKDPGVMREMERMD